MSVHVIYYKDGAKMMRPVLTREEYMSLRDSEQNRRADKKHLVQMNYSCLPDPLPVCPSAKASSSRQGLSSLSNGCEDPRGGVGKTETVRQTIGCEPSVVSNTLPPSGGMGWGLLKGCKTPSNTVGMDIDHLADPTQPSLGGEKSTPTIEEVIAKVMEKKEVLGLLMLEKSASGKGLHLVFRRHPELRQEQNLRWASDLLGVEFDKGAKDITRVFFTPPSSNLIYLDDEVFDPISPTPTLPREGDEKFDSPVESVSPLEETIPNSSFLIPNLNYQGIPYAKIIQKWWELYNDGKEPCPGNRNTLTFELAVNLRNICGFDRNLMDKVIPDYWESPTPSLPREGDEKSEKTGQNRGCDPSVVSNTLPPSGGSGWGREKLACIDSALAEKRTQMPKRLKEVISACKAEILNSNSNPNSNPNSNSNSNPNVHPDLDDLEEESPFKGDLEGLSLPRGIKDSVDAVGPTLAMPVLTAICPAIGALATGVKLDVHGKVRNLNLISYIAGDFASGKGSIDPVVDAWMSEVKAFDKMYQMQEDEWRAKKRAAKNKKEQPEEPKLPVRCLTLNNTVANLAERLANTEGKHAFSFTPEADTVAQKWKSAMSDFSVMLRQSYDGTCYEREARSADAVNVHIDKLLWNVTMCGTPDALYRVVNNYTDGFQSRIAVARTPDNTFAPLEDNPPTLTALQEEHIRQVAHLLPLMHGEVTLDKLEKKGREWVEEIRLETIKDNDAIRARQRFRVCVTAQRMTCCLLLCRVCEQLIQKYGQNGAETRLKQNPNLWKEMLKKAQTPTLLAAYDAIADSLLDNALYFFRDRIESAFNSSSYCSNANGERRRRGKNDSIYERLDSIFTFGQAMQCSIAEKGSGITNNSVQQMLKNWMKQGLIEKFEEQFRKSLVISH